MKKRLLAVLLLILVVLSATGCNKGGLYGYSNISKYVEIKGELKGIKYSVQDTAVTQQQVDDFVNSALTEKNYGEVVEIKDRAVQVGDTANISYVGKRDGVAFEGGTSSAYDLVIGSGTFIPGFEDGVVGMTAGQSKVLNLTFPENYGNAELAGAAVTFDVTVNSIKAKVYPELTDAIVAEISDCATVDEFLEYANAEVLANNNLTAQQNIENEIWTNATKLVKVKKVPEKEIEYFEKYLRDQDEATAYNQYNLELEDYANQAYGSVAKYEQNLKQRAKDTAEQGLVITAIAKKYNIEVTEQEYENMIAENAKSYQYTAEEYKELIDENYFKLSMLSSEVKAFLVDNAVEKK